MSDDEESHIVRGLQTRVTSLECALAQRSGLRREIEELLGVGYTTGDEQFLAAVERVRALVKAEARVAELEGQILAWWATFRPIAFGPQDHIAQPLVNTCAATDSARGILALTAREIAERREP